MDFPSGSGPRSAINDPEMIMSSESSSFEGSTSNDCSYVEDAIPLPISQASDRAAEVVSLDSMRDSMRSGVLTSMTGNFEQDDLDVPAFLRKRNEVM